MSTHDSMPVPKRRWLTFSLRTFLVVTLLLSVVLGYFGRAWWKAYRDSQPPTLRELAQIARRHGIPMPPKDAKLVLAATGGRLGDHYGYAPAFLLEEQAEGGARLLVGTAEATLKPDDLVFSWDDEPNVPVWREFVLDPTPHSNWQAKFNRRSAFVCAAQLANRGEVNTAKAIMKLLAGEKEWDFERYSEIEPELVDLRLLMARCIYDRLENRICKEPQHWPEIRDALDALLTEFPKLGDERAAVLRDLSAAIDAPPAKAGSVEAQLVDWSRRSRVEHGFGVSFYDYDDESDAPVRNIILGGFDAVPELIALQDDERMTTHYQGQIRWGPEPHVMRLGEVADYLLSAIVAFRGPDREEPATAENWRKWFTRVRDQGELAFFRDAVFERDDQGINSVNEVPGHILGQKYPHVLRELCDEFCTSLDRLADSQSLASIVATAQLPHDERVALLVGLVERLPLQQKSAVLDTFALLDKAACVRSLLPVLEKVPPEKDESPLGSPEADLADVVCELDQIDVWRAYLRATRRCNAELRARIISELRYHDDVSKNQLAFLAAFLNDEAERDITLKEGEWRFPQEPFPVISVGNLSAKVLAQLLEMKLKPDPSWTPNEWSALREQVRERLKQGELPELE